MSKCQDRRRSPHARYTIRFYNGDWEEDTSMTCEMVCASALFETLENINRALQRAAREDHLTVKDTGLPNSLCIEVHYV